MKASALPFLRADERPGVPDWLPEERAWGLHPGGPASLGAYRRLCAALASLRVLPGARRRGTALSLPLAAGPFRLLLKGAVTAEFLSSERGQAQRHLHADFPLPGGWTLHWRLCAGQDLATGAVGLRSATAFSPGPRRGFRHILAARALRRALERSIRILGGIHEQVQDRR